MPPCILRLYTVGLSQSFIKQLKLYWLLNWWQKGIDVIFESISTLKTHLFSNAIYITRTFDFIEFPNRAHTTFAKFTNARVSCVHSIRPSARGEKEAPRVEWRRAREKVLGVSIGTRVEFSPLPIRRLYRQGRRTARLTGNIFSSPARACVESAMFLMFSKRRVVVWRVYRYRGLGFWWYSLFFFFFWKRVSDAFID